MFRVKKGIKASYNRQGYIFFVSRQYRELPPEKQEEIKRLCIEHGGAYHLALFEFVTTDATATAVSMRHYISKNTLYRAVKKYYEGFTL